MQDLISRQAAIDALNHELRCGAVINQCGLEMAYEIIEDLPSAELGTNLAEVGTDLISREALLDKFEPWLKVKDYNDGELNMLKAILYEIRFAPELSTNLAEVGTDLISRQQAIDTTWEEPSYTDPINVLTEVRDRIKALPTVQPVQCEDAVSREKVKELAYSQIRNEYSGIALKEQREAMLRIADNVIGLLPSVTPKQRTGKWIDVDVMGMPAQACDQCNTFYPLAYTGGGHHYCPNCGAKMEE